MTAGPVFLRGAAYALGEQRGDYTTIANLAERAAEYRLAPDPALWGWGSVHRTARGVRALAIESGRATLAAAGAAPGSVDALMLCSTSVTEPPERHGELMRDILAGIGLPDIPCYGQNLNRCLNLLVALDTASALVASGRHRQVLVITADRVTDEASRMRSYALFSDGAASCLLTADAGGAIRYSVVGCSMAHDSATLAESGEISADLAVRVNADLLGRHGMKAGDIAALLHPNIFTPIVVMKELQAGFGREQLSTANIARAGHCFAADPLINLADREAAGDIAPGAHYLLAGSVPGARAAVLLRAGRSDR